MELRVLIRILLPQPLDLVPQLLDFVAELIVLNPPGEVRGAGRGKAADARHVLGQLDAMGLQELLVRRQPSSLLLDDQFLLLQRELQLLGRPLVVDLHHVLDHLRTLAEPQGADRLLLVEVGRRARDDEGRLGVAAERLLQHPRELRVAVRHMGGLLVRQRVDDVAKRREGTVDVLGLVQPLARRTRLGHLLAPGEVDQVQLPHLHRAVVQVLLLNGEHEDQVRPRGVLVHVRHGHGAVEVARAHGVEDLLLARNVGLRDLAYEDTPCLVLVDLQVVLFRIEQVAYTLVVDLHDGDPHEKLNVLVCMEDPIEDRPHHSRDHALVHLVFDVRALHCVRLAAGGLPIREHCAVEASQHGVDDGHCGVVVDLLLAGVPREDPVVHKGEISVWHVH
mmetsp:Transcript_29973/g.88968  ORF Transcript_29973/g.88968 Transcript_29973/m.88968 type:complete len:392 (-) Transcript_29973:193-1368(-)